MCTDSAQTASLFVFVLGNEGAQGSGPFPGVYFQVSDGAGEEMNLKDLKEMPNPLPTTPSGGCGGQYGDLAGQTASYSNPQSSIVLDTPAGALPVIAVMANAGSGTYFKSLEHPGNTLTVGTEESGPVANWLMSLNVGGGDHAFRNFTIDGMAQTDGGPWPTLDVVDCQALAQGQRKVVWAADQADQSKKLSYGQNQPICFWQSYYGSAGNFFVQDDA